MKRSFLASALLGLALLAGLVFTVQSSSSTAQTNAQAMAAANQLVNAGHYAEAAQMYEQLAAQNPQDAALLYNLGNARFLHGDAAAALAAYERAAALAPRDADIRANLALAQEALGQQPPAALSGPRAQRWLTSDELALLALGAWFTLGLLVLVKRRHSECSSHAHGKTPGTPSASALLAALLRLCVSQDVELFCVWLISGRIRRIMAQHILGG